METAVDWHEMPKDVRMTYLRAAALTAAQLGRLIEELHRQGELANPERTPSAISEDMLWGDDGEDGYPPSPAAAPDAERWLPHDLDWEPFVAGDGDDRRGGRPLGEAGREGGAGCKAGAGCEGEAGCERE